MNYRTRRQEESMHEPPSDPPNTVTTPPESQAKPDTTNVPLSKEQMLRHIGEELLASAKRQATDPEHRAAIQKLLV